MAQTFPWGTRNHCQSNFPMQTKDTFKMEVASTWSSYFDAHKKPKVVDNTVLPFGNLFIPLVSSYQVHKWFETNFFFMNKRADATKTKQKAQINFC